mmetsp:Transcript_40522/g.53149  ORF Transcript_40522/g.53149 Transcript_40522/m.53149 type:complete len:221 (-) Transcript_40522:4930-5592(-)
MQQAGSRSNPRMGTPMSQKNQKREKVSPPRLDLRLKTKPMKNMYRIQSNSPTRSTQSEKNCQTPSYLKKRNFDPKNLAKMYEMDDVMIFGDFKTQKAMKRRRAAPGPGSDTMSQTSSRRGRDSQNSSRRYRKHKKGVYGETGSDHGFEQESVAARSNVFPISANQSNNGLVLASSMAGQMATEPILEAIPCTGPKSNQGGDSLIQKMNSLMHQTASMPNM